MASDTTSKHKDSGATKTPVLNDKIYDVVVVGAGVAGAILAKKLANAGREILLLEAGRMTSIRPEGYASYVETYQRTAAKPPNSPYPQNANAPAPSVIDPRQIPKDGQPSATGYAVYKGPMPFLSDYTRTLGGTTLHFLGTCIRMVPADFEMQTRYQKGVDWPYKFEDLEPFYEEAEVEMGVSADVEEQEREGSIKFRKGYEFPMRQIPKTYLDKWLDWKIGDLKYNMGGENLPVMVVGTPAGRNSMPNPKWKDPRKSNKSFQPIGAPYDTRMGQRCEGNSACVPICPVMAKYNALRSLYTLDQDYKKNLTIVAQTVASKIEIGPDDQVTGIVCKQYEDETMGESKAYVAKGRRYVIAAHAIETAKLLLASRTDAFRSGLANSSGQVGKNIMDHHYFLTWGLAPAEARLGVFRGPQITSEVPMRDGKFRESFAAFRGDIRNGGWDFCAAAPYKNLDTLVGHGGEGSDGMFGKQLREQLYEDVQRQISFGWQIEQLPDEDNRVTISEDYKDQLGNYRPVISYNVDDYSKRAIAVAKCLSDAILKQVDGEDRTCFKNPNSPGLVHIPASLTPDGKKDMTVEVNGAGHIVGTHRMGKKGEEDHSVCDSDCRTWDHGNLFLVSGGSMPTLGTSNPTLTIAALACKTAKAINKELGKSGKSSARTAA